MRSLNAGKKPMGLLNPFLYANPGAFTDVSSACRPPAGLSAQATVTPTL